MAINNYTTFEELASTNITSIDVYDTVTGGTSGAVGRVILSKDGTNTTGTARAGTANTIQLAADAPNIGAGMLIRITGGTGSGQIRRIIAWNNTSKTATVNPNWATNPDSTSTYSVEDRLTVVLISGNFTAGGENITNQDSDSCTITQTETGASLPTVATYILKSGDVVIVSGDNSASTDIFEDIRAASVAGGWGIHSALDSYTTQLNCLVWFGGRGQTASTIIKTQNERVKVIDGIVSTGNVTYPNTVSVGSGTYKGKCQNGSYITITGEVVFDLNTTFNFYAGTFEDLTNTYSVTFKGTSYICSEARFSSVYYVQNYAGASFDYPIFFGTFLFPAESPAEVSGMTIYNAEYSIFVFSARVTSTVKNITFVNCTYPLGVVLGGGNITFIDCVGDFTSIFVLYGSAKATVQQSVNLKYIDRANANVQNVSSVLKDKNGTQAFSVSSAADGTITEQYVTRYLNDNNSLTDYNDFILYSTKSGYMNEVRKITISKAIDWTIKLIHSPYANMGVEN
jgi:hypothetical protein